MNTRKRTTGFTLIDLMVAIAIFATISIAAFANIRGGTPGQEVQLQADNVTSLLRQAQVQAFSGEPFNGVPPIGGYGVRITVPCSTAPCDVVLFADVNNNLAFDAATEEVETVSLGTNVTINASSLGNGAHDILFKPPRPFMCFDSVCDGLGAQTITIGSDSTAKEVDITLNQVSGQISS